MRTRATRAVLTTAVVGAAALSLGLGTTIAHADTAPRSVGTNSDVVGVGSDTLQNAVDFLFDQNDLALTTADAGTQGYNGIGNLNRVFNVYATGDSNGRATYDGTCGQNGTTALTTQCSTANTGTPNILAGTVILRGGTSPVARPNGSGAGVAALEADSIGNPGYQGLPNGSIQFARMSRLPNAGEISACPTSTTTIKCGGLHAYQIATDNLAVAHLTTGFDGPSTGLSTQDLINIYTCQTTKWNQLPGNSGGSSATIQPLIPQTGSGTRNFFLADLTAANNNVAVNPGTCVGTVEEHDPDGIVNNDHPADAVEPFSTGKLALINSGYFANGGAAFTPNKLSYFASGNTADGTSAATYFSTRGLYVVVRQYDLNSAPVFQPGGTKNWVKTLLDGPTSYAASAAEAGNIEAAGFTPAYINCGVLTTSTCSSS